MTIFISLPPVRQSYTIVVREQYVSLFCQLLVSPQIGKVPPSTNFGGLFVNRDLSRARGFFTPCESVREQSEEHTDDPREMSFTYTKVGG
jgi:hypothetical protein